MQQLAFYLQLIAILGAATALAYWAGWGLFALGAVLALVVIALYVRFWPGFSRPKS